MLPRRRQFQRATVATAAALAVCYAWHKRQALIEFVRTLQPPQQQTDDRHTTMAPEEIGRRHKLPSAGLMVRAAVRIQTAWRQRMIKRLREVEPEMVQHTRLVRADTGCGGLMEVDVALNVMSIYAIDAVEQRFSCEFVLRVRTLNASTLRTQHTGERVTHANWEPRIRILNLIAVERWRSEGHVALPRDSNRAPLVQLPLLCSLQCSAACNALQPADDVRVRMYPIARSARLRLRHERRRARI